MKNHLLILICLVTALCILDLSSGYPANPYTNAFSLRRAKRNANCPKGDSVKKQVVCYFGRWAKYRSKEGAFEIDDIDPNLCTHLIYSFAGLDPNTNEIKSLDSNADIDQKGYKKAVALKEKNPELKVLLAIGGWTEGSASYSRMAKSPASIKKFTNSVVETLNEYGFDGLDVDWEYPTKRGGVPQDKENFVKLLKELNQSLKKEGKLLTVAVGVGEDTVSSAYDIKGISDNVDGIHLMTYDLKASWDNKTGHQTNMKDVKSAVNRFLQGGANPSKLIMGTASYGRTFTAPNNKGELGVFSNVGGKMGPYTREKGFLGYNEICKQIQDGELQRKQGTEIDPIAYNEDQFVGYDTPESIKIKCEWAMNKCLGGCMNWEIDTDDFRGKCRDGKYPLLRALNEAVGNEPGEVVSSMEIPVEIEETEESPDESTEEVSSEETIEENQGGSSSGSEVTCLSTGISYIIISKKKLIRCVHGQAYAVKASHGTCWQINGEYRPYLDHC